MRYRTDDSGVLVDAYGRDQFVKSTEVHFPTSLKFTVSKYYPLVYGKSVFHICFAIHSVCRASNELVLQNILIVLYVT